LIPFVFNVLISLEGTLSPVALLRCRPCGHTFCRPQVAESIGLVFIIPGLSCLQIIDSKKGMVALTGIEPGFGTLLCFV
jgi:hypothetical protein